MNEARPHTDTCGQRGWETGCGFTAEGMGQPHHHPFKPAPALATRLGKQPYSHGFAEAP